MATSPTRKHLTRVNKHKCASQKTCYPTKADALDGAEAMMDKGMVWPGCHITPYECEECGLWHVWNKVIVRPGTRRDGP